MNVVLIQLPIPRLNFGRKTGSIPLGAACLAEAAANIPDTRVTVVPESRAAFLGDGALLSELLAMQPEAVGFTVFCWNVKRSLFFAECLKAACGARILFGGPEVTPDNPTIRSDVVDVHVCGEGEAVFHELLSRGIPDSPTVRSAPAGELFTAHTSPYLAGRLEPGIEDLMLLETQRGCPYRCGYCYYRKSMKSRSVVWADLVLAGVRWAVTQGIKELFFLDPSINTRPDLPAFLDAVAAINHQKTVGMLSEIRAEAITPDLADRFAAAGFTWFEIGLQSINPGVQRIMNRTTKPEAFLRGTRLLKERGISAGVDLILGLPGDDLTGFMASVDFMAAHHLTDDVQVFQLSVLPGTDFRRRAHELGLVFDPDPPYPVIQTTGFSSEDLRKGIDYAEDRLGTVFYPMPDLNLHYRCRERDAITGDGHYRPPAMPSHISKILLRKQLSQQRLEKIARALTHPYQVFVWPAAKNDAFLKRALGRFSEINPFTPFEVVFMGWTPRSGTGDLLSAVNLQRPHYLDLDMRGLFPDSGNRAVLFTIVLEEASICVTGSMERQVFWWRRDRLPETKDLSDVEMLHGILIDGQFSDETIGDWQKKYAPRSNDMPAVTFADADHHRAWVSLTSAENYYLMAL